MNFADPSFLVVSLKDYLSSTKPSQVLRDFHKDSLRSVLKQHGVDLSAKQFNEDEFKQTGTVTYRELLPKSLRPSFRRALLIATAEDVLRRCSAALQHDATIKNDISTNKKLKESLQIQFVKELAELATKKKPAKEAATNLLVSLARTAATELSLDLVPPRERGSIIKRREAAAEFVLRAVNGSEAPPAKADAGVRFLTLEDHAKMIRGYNEKELREALPAAIRAAAYTGDLSAFVADYDAEREKEAERKRKSREKMKAEPKKKKAEANSAASAPPAASTWASIQFVHKRVVVEKNFDSLEGSSLYFAIGAAEDILRCLKQEKEARLNPPAAASSSASNPQHSVNPAAAAASSSSSSSGRGQGGGLNT